MPAKVGQLGARIFEIQLRATLIEYTLGLVALNRKLSADPRVESVLLPFSDGLNFARVR